MQILKSLHALCTRRLHINLLMYLMPYNKDLAGRGGGDGRKRLAHLSISRYGFWVKEKQLKTHAVISFDVEYIYGFV